GIATARSRSNRRPRPDERWPHRNASDSVRANDSNELCGASRFGYYVQNLRENRHVRIAAFRGIDEGALSCRSNPRWMEKGTVRRVFPMNGINVVALRQTLADVLNRAGYRGERIRI